MEIIDFVSYDIAKGLKSIGFDIPCAFYYTKEDAGDGHVWITSDGVTEDHNHVKSNNPFAVPVCSAPSYHTTLEWLRNKYMIHCFAVVDDNLCCEGTTAIWQGGKQWIDGGLAIPVDGRYATCADALEAAIKSVIAQVS